MAYNNALTKNINVGITYLFLGMLATLLSIPPGFSSPIWPAAGFALAAVICEGPIVLPGVFFGSWLTNILISVFATSEISPVNITFTMLIGVGALLQAYIGGYILTRILKRPYSLIFEKDILSLILFGAILGSLVNATISPVVLYTFGVIDYSKLFTTMFIWWVGDAIGIILLTPCLLLLFEGNKISHSRMKNVIIPLGILILLVMVSFALAKKYNQQLVKQKIYTIATQQLNLVENKYIELTHALAYLNKLYESSNKVTRLEFNSFINSYIKVNPGIFGIGWTPRVYENELQNFITTTRVDGVTSFDVFGVSTQGKFEKQQHSSYSPILYFETMNNNEFFLGFDFTSNEYNKSVINQAMRTGDIRATKRLNFFEKKSFSNAIITFYPVYKNNTIVSGEDSRVKNYTGSLFCVFIIDDFINQILKENPNLVLDMNIRDITSGEKNFLYGRTLFDKNMSVILPLSIADREWEITFTPNSLFDKDLYGFVVWVFLIGSMFLVALIEIFLLLLTGRADLIELKVREKTKDLYETNSLLSESSQIAANASKDKNQFLSNFSYEIRSPLTNILGNIDIALNIICNEKNSEVARNNVIDNLGKIKKNGEELFSLVENIFDFTKVNEDGLSEYNEVVIFDLIYDLIDSMQSDIALKGIKLDLHMDNMRYRKFNADPKRLKHIMKNVLHEALHNSPSKKEVKIFISYQNKTQYLVFEVLDQGPPMAINEDNTSCHIYTDGLLNSSIRNFSLPLLIARDIAMMMNGDLEYTHSKEVGTSIKVKLHIIESKVNLNHKFRDNKIDFQKYNILFADDSYESREIIQWQLDKHSVKYNMKENGKEALEEAYLIKYDLIVLDIEMPDMNGVEVVKKLRQDEFDIPIIALTANVNPSQISAYLDSGFTDVITKPFKEETLINMVSHYLLISKKEEVDNQLGINKEINFLKKTFLESLPSTLELIKKSYEEGDINEVKRLLLSLKTAFDHYKYDEEVYYTSQIFEQLNNGNLLSSDLESFCSKVNNLCWQLR